MAVMEGLAYYDERFVRMAEHWDDFLLARTIKNPNFWHDRIPRGAYKLYSGLTQKSNIYRGGLPVQAGLSDWTALATSRKPNAGTGDPGFDNCAMGTPHTYNTSLETVEYSGWKDEYQSLPICVNDLKFIDSAKEQLALIIRSGVEYGISIIENWSKEMYVQQAMLSNRGMVMATGGTWFEDNANVRFSYDPFARMLDADGANVPYITIPAGAEMSTLNWSYLDYLSWSLADRAGEAAISRESNMPVFGLMIDVMDFERMVKDDPDLRADWRATEGNAAMLIEGYPMALRSFRRYGVIHDARQMRFRVHGYDESGDILATRVLPLRSGRAATIGNVPEPNPAYYHAEIGIGVVFMNDVLTNLFVPTVDSLGSGTSFGATPGLNGQWAWMNIRDNVTNRLGEWGYFYGRYEVFPKPGLFASEATVFAYKRCPHSLRTACAVQSHSDAVAVGTDTSVAANAAAGDVDLTNRRVTLTLAGLLKGGPGDNVSILLDHQVEGITENDRMVAQIASSAEAPKYTFIWKDGETKGDVLVALASAASAAAAFTAAVSKVKVTA